MTDIYSRVPINKTAALVSSQAGCREEESLADKRDSMARSINRMVEDIKRLPKNDKKRNELGIKIQSLQQDIRSINKMIKQDNIIGQSLDSYVIKECMERFSMPVWFEIMAKAKANKKLADSIASEDCKNQLID